MSALAALGALLLLLLAIACEPPPAALCTSTAECLAQANCAAGRCVARGVTPAINTARRLLFTPRDVAYIRRGETEVAPAVATLGRGDGGTVLLRFEATLAEGTTVLEAYLLLDRVEAGDSPGQVLLHAVRVVEPWSGASVTWATQPRLLEEGLHPTRVTSGSGAEGSVRLDLRNLVERWRRREGGDYGVAVVADGVTGAGIRIALAPLVALAQDPDGLAALAAPAAPATGRGSPCLELYVK